MTTDDILFGILLALVAKNIAVITYVAMPFLRGAFHHLRTRREA